MTWRSETWRSCLNHMRQTLCRLSTKSACVKGVRIRTLFGLSMAPLVSPSKQTSCSAHLGWLEFSWRTCHGISGFGSDTLFSSHFSIDHVKSHTRTRTRTGVYYAFTCVDLNEAGGFCHTSLFALLFLSFTFSIVAAGFLVARPS